MDFDLFFFRIVENKIDYLFSRDRILIYLKDLRTKILWPDEQKPDISMKNMKKRALNACLNKIPRKSITKSNENRETEKICIFRISSDDRWKRSSSTYSLERIGLFASSAIESVNFFVEKNSLKISQEIFLEFQTFSLSIYRFIDGIFHTQSSNEWFPKEIHGYARRCTRLTSMNFLHSNSISHWRRFLLSDRLLPFEFFLYFDAFWYINREKKINATPLLR